VDGRRSVPGRPARRGAADGGAAHPREQVSAEPYSGEGEAALDALLDASLPPERRRVDQAPLRGLREQSRTPLADHHYLSLLATDPANRGRGIGQALLAANLAEWDQEEVPAYRESTNGGNDHRYIRAGSRPIGGFRAVRDDTWISAMWRDVGGSAGE
jgi:GNAT superfamily N-acetyltransferase